MSTLRFLAILLAIAGLLIGYGFYQVENGDAAEGHKVIGFSTAFIFLILMPAFIWLRYKDKDFSKFNLDQNQRKDESKKQDVFNSDDCSQLN